MKNMRVKGIYTSVLLCTEYYTTNPIIYPAIIIQGPPNLFTLSELSRGQCPNFWLTRHVLLLLLWERMEKRGERRVGKRGGGSWVMLMAHADILIIFFFILFKKNVLSVKALWQKLLQQTIWVKNLDSACFVFVIKCLKKTKNGNSFN